VKFIKTDLAKKLELEATKSMRPTNIELLDFTPRRATPGSAGYDLRAAIEQPITIYPDQVEKIPTGVKVWIGSDLEDIEVQQLNGTLSIAAFLLPRSSTEGAILNNTVGVCDEDYQGEIFVKLRNITPAPITITPGQAFAQATFPVVYVPSEMEEVDTFEVTTVRGEGGFGSTDKNQDDILGR
jgi:dUTP pyrophosphatase